MGQIGFLLMLIPYGLCLNPEHESKKLETALKLITPKCSNIPQRVAEHIYDSPIIPGPRKNAETIVLEQDSDSELSPEDRDDLEEQAFEYEGLTDYIRICADIGPSYLQELSVAAAIQGKTVKEVLYQQTKNKGSVKKGGPPSSCFSYGQLGHRMAQCPKKNNLDSTKNPDVCPRCKKKKKKEKISAAEQLIQEQLQLGHIEPSNSPWNSPIFLINLGEGLCMCFSIYIGVGTKKGARKWHEETKQQIGQLREQRYRTVT
nr:uncharacterized protein LOC110135498 [Odocoileus virginianus texanus]